MLARFLLKTLLYTITPRTAEILANELADLFERLAAKTETDLDDQLVELLKRFILRSETPPKPGEPRAD